MKKFGKIEYVPREYWVYCSLRFWAGIKKKDSSSCDTCRERFKCWTARPHSIFSNDDLYHTSLSIERIQAQMKANMMTVEEVSEAFKKLGEEMLKSWGNL